MRTLLLLSTDRLLAGQVAAALRVGELVQSLPRRPSKLVLPGLPHEVLVVLDCRETKFDEVGREIAQVRATNQATFRCVALVARLPQPNQRISVTGRNARCDFDILLAADDDVGITLRAMLNDVDGTVGIARSLEALRGVLGLRAIRIAESVLTSGCRVDGVGRVATALGTDRSALWLHLAAESGLMPKEVVRIARATYAVVLAVRGILTLNGIASRIHYSAGRYVQELLESEFGARAEGLRTRSEGMPIKEFLDLILTEWGWRRSSGGGGDVAPALRFSPGNQIRLRRRPISRRSGHNSCPTSWLYTTINTVKNSKVPRRVLAALAIVAVFTVGCGKADPAGAAAKTKTDSSSSTKKTVKAGDSTSSVAQATAAAAGESRVNLPVVAEAARDGDLVLTVNTTGQVRSDAEAKLRSEVTGTVQTVHVRPGDRVKAGQPIMTLDPRPFDLAVRAAEVTLQESMLKAQDNYVPDSIVSGKGPSVERRKNAELRNGVDANRVRLETAKLDRERAIILAPFNGVVDKVSVSGGERLSAGGDVATVVDVEKLRVEAAVLEHDLPLVKVGGTATVSSAAAPNATATGRVISVLPLVDSTTRAGRAYVRLTGNGVLRPGMYADLRLEATRLTKRRLVPDRAVIERDGRPLIFIVKSGRAQWTYVNPGRSNGREREILPDSATGQIPVKPGDLVITEGHLTLTHDAPVRVVSKRETAVKP